MKLLSKLIEETLETLLLDHCYSVGLDEDQALIIFARASQNREGVLRMAQRYGMKECESLIELAPEAVMLIDKTFGKKAGSDEIALTADAERAILALFLGSIQAMGNDEISRERKDVDVGFSSN